MNTNQNVSTANSGNVIVAVFKYFEITKERLDVLEMFIGDLNKRQVITKIIAKFTDIEMLCRKIQRGKAGLQDLYKIYQMLKMVPMVVEALTKDFPHRCVEEIFVSDFQGIMDDCEKFVDMISQTLDFDAIENKEFVVKAEFDEKLSDLRKQMSKCKSKIDDELDQVDVTNPEFYLPSKVIFTGAEASTLLKKLSKNHPIAK
ncbi:DNA mismatch repair protein Msh2 [Trichonephila clavipes]|nr:DNA mismatch repair protein Msh2 [Trichonephila clavipes]